MTDDQWECAKLLADLFGGFHHITTPIRAFGSGIELNAHANHLATYDFDGLTRLVVLAHDRMVRAEIRPSGPRMLKFALWKRHTREGSMFERHPTMEDAVRTVRQRHQTDKDDAN